jgi:glycosyltransferase involved in cell wall biosynthesis
MRIAQLAPLAETVPPRQYGGTERVVSWLTEELVALGQDVTLFASAGSVTRANLVPVWPCSIRHSRPRPEPAAPLTALLEAIAERASEFDIIHAHVDWVHLPLLSRLGTPFLTTFHGRLDTPHLSLAARGAGRPPFVSISNSQRAPLPELNWLATVYHGLPTTLLKQHRQGEGYLAFLGRISPDKGPHTAIRLAKAAGLPLRIAAKVPRDGNRFFKSEIEPLLDGNTIEFIGEVNDRGKMELLGKARALLFPIDWPEPFGLVMIEAMACGTPVIAWRRGSVPEIIDDGVTGFVVDNELEAMEAINRVGDLDRDRIRAAFERRFTSARMAEDYLRIYRSLRAERSTDLTETPAPRVAAG